MSVVVAVVLTTHGSHAYAQATPTVTGVYYVGAEDAIAKAIDLAAPYVVRVDQPDLAQVIVINNAPLRESLRAFSAEIQQGRVGLVLFAGPLFPQTADDLRALLAVSTFGLAQTAAPESVQLALVDDPLQHAIAWRSAPEIRARTLIVNPNLLRPVVTAGVEQGLVQRVRGREQTQVLIVDGWFTHPSNADWPNWAYFNYLVYHLVSDAAGASRTLSYVDYPRSPTPDRAGRLGLAGAGVGLMVTAGTLYYAARRRLYLSPSLATAWQKLTTQAGAPPAHAAWRTVGFHRPLAGFLTSLPLSLMLLLPLLAYRVAILPDFLFPDRRGLEIWTMVSNWTMIFWVLLDAGTAAAAIRLFSTYHIHFPQQAARYIQFYVWWQLLSGAIQLGVICILAATAFPVLGLAHLTYTILARAVLQVPGFLGVFAVMFSARQRFDYQQSLSLLTTISIPLLQAIAIRLIVPWGAIRPEMGAGLAGSIGVAAGILLAEGLAFLLGANLQLRAGHSLSALFLPTFDKHTAAEALTFGLPWAISVAIPVLGFVLQTEVLDARLTPPDLRAENWQHLLLVAASFEVLLVGLYRAVMPMLSEARSLNYKALIRYTASQAVRYGAWFSFFLFATLGALGERLLATDLAARYRDLAPWLMPVLAWGALQWAVWLPDRMLEAAGRPWLMVLGTLVEQAVRIGGSLVLLPLWGTGGVFAAWGAGLLLHSMLVRIFASAALVRVRIYVWQTLIAPAAGAMLLYQLLRLGLGAWSPATWASAGSISISALLTSLLVYAFLTALMGGWDDGALADLRQAARLSSIGLPFAWLLLQCVRLGARVSPLHGRFPIALYDWAQQEAAALTLAQSQPER
ncbi:MAG: hypothetical protein MUF84_19540 [Anaerolineae bacterium]|nr:hypothetical protein [Anaerolineae bacterium]